MAWGQWRARVSASQFRALGMLFGTCHRQVCLRTDVRACDSTLSILKKRVNLHLEVTEIWAGLLTIKTRDKGRDDASTRTLVSTDAGSIGHRVGTEALIRLGATRDGQTPSAPRRASAGRGRMRRRRAPADDVRGRVWGEGAAAALPLPPRLHGHRPFAHRWRTDKPACSGRGSGLFDGG
jgi:hypothetical protein